MLIDVAFQATFGKCNNIFFKKINFSAIETTPSIVKFKPWAFSVSNILHLLRHKDYLGVINYPKIDTGDVSLHPRDEVNRRLKSLELCKWALKNSIAWNFVSILYYFYSWFLSGNLGILLWAKGMKMVSERRFPTWKKYSFPQEIKKNTTIKSVYL